MIGKKGNNGMVHIMIASHGPMAAAMVAEGCPFTGILYAGCMATARGVKTIEYNVRFGDPETEVLMIALQDDLYEICTQVLKHQEMPLHWSSEPVLGVVLASQGYPESSTKGAPIRNLETVNATVFHMGTAERTVSWLPPGAASCLSPPRSRR